MIMKPPHSVWRKGGTLKVVMKWPSETTNAQAKNKYF